MTSPTTNGANIYLPPSPMAPMVLDISSITQATQMVVTTTTANEWVVGQKAYFSIPIEYGMQQLNKQTSQIVSIDTTNLIFTFSINSSQFDAFNSGADSFQDAVMASQGASNTYNFTQLPYHAINPSVGN